MSQVSRKPEGVNRSSPEAIAEMARLERLHGDVRVLRYNQPLEALRLCEDSLRRCQAVGYVEGEACSLLLASLTRNQLGQTREAEELEVRGLEVFERALRDPDGPRSGELRLALSIVFSARGRTQEAHLNLLELLELARNQGHLLWEAYAKHDLSLLFQTLGDTPAALEAMFECVKIQRAVPDKPGYIAFSLANLGSMYLEGGEAERAETCLEEALELARVAGDVSTEARVLLNLADLAYRSAGASRAEDFVERARACSIAIRDEPGQGACEDFLSALRTAEGRHQEALMHFERASPLLARGLTLEELGFRTLRLAQLRLALNGDPGAPEVLEHLNSALELGRSSGGKRLEAAALLALAELHERRSEFERALFYLKAVRDTEKQLFNEASDRRAKSLSMQFETERVLQSAAAARERSADLERLNAELNHSNEEKAQLLMELQGHNLRLEHLSQRDPLTGLYNRRALEERFSLLHQRLGQLGTGFCVAVADIDHFKNINDRYSHAVGDEVLRLLAQLMLEACRGGDLVSRYGGEEFVLILPDTSLEAGLSVCERLRLAVQEHPWSALHDDLHVTISLGLLYETSSGDLKDLLFQADIKMYTAKRLGRNRVVA